MDNMDMGIMDMDNNKVVANKVKNSKIMDYNSNLRELIREESKKWHLRYSNNLTEIISKYYIL
jgi:hypothetical protein